MRWFAVALGLVALLIGSSAWIALRDWAPGDAPDAERVQALHNGRQLLRLTEGSGPCATCRVVVQETGDEHLWRVKLWMPGRQLCFDVDNNRFGVSGARGVAGARPVDCPAS